MSQSNYADFYRNVPDDQRADYLRFRETHKFRSHRVEGVTWHYIDTQAAPHQTVPLLILVGGLRVADASYRAITILETEHRIIAPTYPRLNTISALADGIAALLDALKIQVVDVLGGSFGGMVAQSLVQRHGRYVRKLILSSTGLMTESTMAERKKLRRLLRLMPDWMVRRSTERRLFTIINPPIEAHAFWLAYLRELFSQRLKKADVLSTLACIIDFGENVVGISHDWQEWRGDVLIIGSDDDHTFGDSGQHHLLDIFPSAEVLNFSNAGHSPSITQTDVYFRLIQAFLHT